MRLADTNVLTLEEGAMIPPLEVRMDLKPGDKVGLYMVNHNSMGVGLSPIEAIVLGSQEEGWFVGETEDGHEITFNADQVMDVELAPNSMGGFIDWVKKLMPPAPGGTGLPALPAAPKRSPFEALTTGPLIERPGSEVAPYVKPSSQFAIFDPGTPSILTPFRERAASIILPDRPGPLAPTIEKALQPFAFVPESAPPETFEAKQSRQMDLWSSMFEPEKEGASQADIFRGFTPQEIQPEEEAAPAHLEDDVREAVKVLPLPRRTTLLPSVEDVARGFATFYHLDDLWNDLRDARNTERWNQELEEVGISRFPMESIGACGGPPDIFEELASFLHIPWQEFRKRAVIEETMYEGKPVEEWISNEDVWMEIMFPASEIIVAALDMLKPADLPGHFMVEQDEEGHGCMMVISYVEGELRADEEESSSWLDLAQKEDEEGEEEEEEDLPPPPPPPKKKKKSKKKGG